MRRELQARVQQMAAGLAGELMPVGVDEKLVFEIRRQPPAHFCERGEFACNIALALAAKIKSSSGGTPGELARELAQQWNSQHLQQTGVECVATRGFLNFRMNDETLQNSITRAAQEGERYGAAQTLGGQRVNVEFVSADPTGPLHLVHGRIAVAGDALCRLLAWQGADVTREYFLNDNENSSKMRLLGESVAGLYNQQFGHGNDLPEGALDDDFVRAVAIKIAQREGNNFLLRPEAERVSAFAHEARESAVENQKQTLRALNVNFDVWTSESNLSNDGRVGAIVARLQKGGHVFEKSGALWLETSKFGDEVDRPLRRANGEYTYLASDIAYHAYRFERGFDWLVNIWTAQHEQYLPRTRAALQAADCSPEQLEVMVCESARLSRDGVPIESEREYLLNDALQEIDAQNLRFLLLLAEWKETAQIELDVARRDDEANPAYAARLLPSRLSTLMRQATAREEPASSPENWTAAERQLARFVALWPDEAAQAMVERRPQRVARFVLELAEATRQLLAASAAGANPPASELLRAAHYVAGNALRVLGIKARDNF